MPSTRTHDDNPPVQDTFTREDGAILRFRIDGNRSPQSIVLVFVNEILTNLNL
ncbi:hypothetical protein MMC10_000882 [Thelotrema lepadinum]|nr:hypothetical protein [Thelotrema lepadinum]